MNETPKLATGGNYRRGPSETISRKQLLKMDEGDALEHIYQQLGHCLLAPDQAQARRDADSLIADLLYKLAEDWGYDFPLEDIAERWERLIRT